ncbi:MAG: hypothetical protein D6730_00780, partial [Bacteroidetes bacterium]
MHVFDLELTEKRKRSPLEEWLRREFIERKLNSPFGYAFLMLCALGLSFIFALKGVVVAIVGTALVIGMPLAVASMFNLRFGIILITIISYFVLG